MNKAAHSLFLVDDHPLVREWLTQLIQGQPDLSVCGEASTANKAITEIVRLRPHIAIIDISLPDQSGLELIKAVKYEAPETKILVLSMHEEPIFAERAFSAGANGYIVKRETAHQMVQAIRDVLSGELYISSLLKEDLLSTLSLGRKDRRVAPDEILSQREFQIFEALGRGELTRTIATSLDISMKTVQTYCSRMKDKLGLRSASALVREAVLWHERRK